MERIAKLYLNNKEFSLIDAWYVSVSSFGRQKIILYYRIVVSLVCPSLSIWVRRP